jgi:hypothetical protein
MERAVTGAIFALLVVSVLISVSHVQPVKARALTRMMIERDEKKLEALREPFGLAVMED